MSENINFISVNELPVAEGNEVSVLCVENGAMKQKPKVKIGGGGYILMLTAEEVAIDDTALTITADCTDMVTAIETGANVMVVLPAGLMGESQPAVGMSVNAWMVMPNDEGVNMLVGGCLDFQFVFITAPIPSFLQE